MTQKQKIAELEAEIAELKMRIVHLEARPAIIAFPAMPTPPAPPINPWSPAYPYTVYTVTDPCPRFGDGSLQMPVTTCSNKYTSEVSN